VCSLRETDARSAAIAAGTGRAILANPEALHALELAGIS
jgi:hypothetical protein